MVPLIINPIYTLYSGYLLGFIGYIPFFPMRRSSFLCCSVIAVLVFLLHDLHDYCLATGTGEEIYVHAFKKIVDLAFGSDHQSLVLLK